jgi:hypothetical protein
MGNTLSDAFQPLEDETETAARINGRKFAEELILFIDFDRPPAYLAGVARSLRSWSDGILGQPYSEQRVMTQAEAEQYGSRPITFGKHAGLPIKDVPLDYLQWLADAQNELCAYLRSDVGRKRGE